MSRTHAARASLCRLIAGCRRETPRPCRRHVRDCDLTGHVADMSNPTLMTLNGHDAPFYGHLTSFAPKIGWLNRPSHSSPPKRSIVLWYKWPNGQFSFLMRSTEERFPRKKILRSVEFDSSGVRLMFVRITTNRTPRPNSLGDLGMTSGSNPIVSLNEFTYKKGTEIFGEKERVRLSSQNGRSSKLQTTHGWSPPDRRVSLGRRYFWAGER